MSNQDLRNWTKPTGVREDGKLVDAERPKHSDFVESALTPNTTWKRQSFEYYAAHFLVGAGLTTGDLDGHIRCLAYALRKEYEAGVEHGRNVTEVTAE